MLHELLLAILGTTGGIIVDSGESGFQVNPKLTFFSPAEVEIINRIVSLGHLYKRIVRFTLQYGGIGTKLAI